MQNIVWNMEDQVEAFQVEIFWELWVLALWHSQPLPNAGIALYIITFKQTNVDPQEGDV